MGKPKVLLCWPYQRLSWIKVFEHLKSEIDFVYLNFIDKRQDTSGFSGAPKLYWSDFNNADEILEQEKPAKVVFMGIDGPFAMLLNAACRRKGIPTYFLQHGIFHPYKAYLEEERLEKASASAKATSFSATPVLDTKKTALQFMLRSFRLSNIPVYINIARLILLRKLLGSDQKALYYSKSRARRADKYIVYTRFSSSMLAERDGVKDAAFCETGNPEADEIIASIQSGTGNASGEKYLLLIDDPLAEVKDYNTAGFIPVEKVTAFHNKINQYALQQGWRLKIKLHPYSYTSDFYQSHENIDFIKDADIVSLIRGSEAVVGVLSTLLVPAIYLKPCCVFRFNDKYDFHHFLESTGYCRVLNYLNFSINDIRLNYDVTTEQKSAFIKAYLFSDDAGALGRIKNILLSKQ